MKCNRDKRPSKVQDILSQVLIFTQDKEIRAKLLVRCEGDMATNRAVLPDRGPRVAINRHYGDLEVVRVDVTKWEAVFRVRSDDGLTGPEFTTRLSMIQPQSDEDSGLFWKMLVEDVVRVIKEKGECPDFVKGYEVTTDEDSTGEPALYVKILVKPTQGIADDETVSKWNEFVNLVQDSLMRLRLQRWPYVRLGEWRRKR